jgi:hypothetical protein
VVEAGGRQDRARRAVVRDLDRQGRLGDPGAGRRFSHRHQGARGHDRRHQHGRGRDRRVGARRGSRCGAHGAGSAGRQPAPAPAPEPEPEKAEETPGLPRDTSPLGSTSRRSSCRRPCACRRRRPRAFERERCARACRGAGRLSRPPDERPRAHVAAGQDDGESRERRPAHRARHRRQRTGDAQRHRALPRGPQEGCPGAEGSTGRGFRIVRAARALAGVARPGDAGRPCRADEQDARDHRRTTWCSRSTPRRTSTRCSSST